MYSRSAARIKQRMLSSLLWNNYFFLVIIFPLQWISFCWLELSLMWQSSSMLLLTSDQRKYQQGQTLTGVPLWANESMSAFWMDEVSRHCYIFILCQLYCLLLPSFCFTQKHSNIFSFPISRSLSNEYIIIDIIYFLTQCNISFYQKEYLFLKPGDTFFFTPNP